MRTTRPTDRQTVETLRLVGRVIGASCAYQRDGHFYFQLASGWTLAVSADDAGRFRLAACYGTTEVGTLWARATDRRRLAALAVGLAREAKEYASLTRRG